MCLYNSSGAAGGLKQGGSRPPRGHWTFTETFWVGTVRSAGTQWVEAKDAANTLQGWTEPHNRD